MALPHSKGDAGEQDEWQEEPLQQSAPLPSRTHKRNPSYMPPIYQHDRSISLDTINLTQPNEHEQQMKQKPPLQSDDSIRMKYTSHFRPDHSSHDRGKSASDFYFLQSPQPGFNLNEIDPATVPLDPVLESHYSQKSRDQSLDRNRIQDTVRFADHSLRDEGITPATSQTWHDKSAAALTAEQHISMSHSIANDSASPTLFNGYRHTRQQQLGEEGAQEPSQSSLSAHHGATSLISGDAHEGEGLTYSSMALQRNELNEQAESCGSPGPLVWEPESHYRTEEETRPESTSSSRRRKKRPKRRNSSPHDVPNTSNHYSVPDSSMGLGIGMYRPGPSTSYPQQFHPTQRKHRPLAASASIHAPAEGLPRMPSYSNNNFMEFQAQHWETPQIDNLSPGFHSQPRFHPYDRPYRAPTRPLPQAYPRFSPGRATTAHHGSVSPARGFAGQGTEHHLLRSPPEYVSYAQLVSQQNEPTSSQINLPHYYNLPSHDRYYDVQEDSSPWNTSKWHSSSREPGNHPIPGQPEDESSALIPPARDGTLRRAALRESSAEIMMSQIPPLPPDSNQIPGLDLAPMLGRVLRGEPEDESMQVPGSNYSEEAVQADWSEESTNELLSLLDAAERYKWKYMSDVLSRQQKKRIPLRACKNKFEALFGETEYSSMLKSSLFYVAYRSGWDTIKALTTEQERRGESESSEIKEEELLHDQPIESQPIDAQAGLTPAATLADTRTSSVSPRKNIRNPDHQSSEHEE